jgi:nicotinate phosphoribosyltransferase
VPGILQVRRFRAEDGNVADCIYDELSGIPSPCVIVDPLDHTRRREIPGDMHGEDLLVPVFRAGRLVYPRPSLESSRRRTLDELSMLHAGVKRFVHPHQYPVGLEKGLFDLRTRLILETRRVPPAAL